MTRPFRFGLHLWELPADDWAARVRRYEELGYDSVTLTDHVVVPQWDPFVGLSAIAAVTRRLRLGTLVLDMALRNPVLVAKAAATLERISAGRLELGLGAGYVAANFSAAGVPFESAADRIARLEEALSIMRLLWRQPTTTFEGRFFTVREAPMMAAESVSPTLLLGGGGPSVLRLAGRAADIASMIPRQPTGEWSVPRSVPDSTRTRLKEKADWVLEAAVASDRDESSVELNTMVPTVLVGDRPEAAVRRTSEELGVPVEAMRDSSLFLLGNAEEVGEHLLAWRAATGISYWSLFGLDEETISWFAERVIAPLRVL